MQLVTKEAIKGVLLPHTVKRFHQHQETPIGSGDRSRGLGQDCSSADFEHIWHGTYNCDLANLSEEAREWIQQLKENDFVFDGRIISTNILTKDLISGWMKMRESTASAPGGHYGHYKTAATVARLPHDHPQHTRVLAEIYATMLSMTLAHGFAPTRWQYCVDAILEKIPGKLMIEKLRIIMLYKADFNFVLKLICGHYVMQRNTSVWVPPITDRWRDARQSTRYWKNFYSTHMLVSPARLSSRSTTMRNHVMIE
jgi:hypothetical protein